MAAGFFSGMTFIMLQTKGAFLFSCIMIVIILYYRKYLNKVIYFLLGAAIPTSMLFFWPVKVLWAHLIQFPMQYYLPFNRMQSTSFILSIVLLMISGVLLYLLKTRRETWILCWVQLFLIFSTYTRPDAYHIILNSVFLPVIFFIVIEKFFEQFPSLRQASLFRFPFILLYCFAVAVIFFRLFILYFSQNLAGFRISEFLQLKNPYLDTLVQYVQKNSQPKDFIYSGPFVPNFYFETQRMSPTRFHYVITGYFPQEYVQEMAEDIKKNKPILALLNYDNVRQYNYDKENAVEKVLREYYTQDLVISGVSVYKLKAGEDGP